MVPSPCQSCGCKFGNAPTLRTINAHSNTVGPALLHYVPELETLHKKAGLSDSLMDYGNPSSAVLKDAIAEFTCAGVDEVIASGSTLRDIQTIALTLSATEIVCLKGDFLGYSRASLVHALPLIIKDASTGRDDSCIPELADTVKKLEKPIVYATMCITNPMQTNIDAETFVQAMAKANPQAIIVIDLAYVEFFGQRQHDFTYLAERENVIIITPASKILFHPGIAAGWMIIGDPQIRSKVEAAAYPYPMPGIGAALVPELLSREDIIDNARKVVCEARNILTSGMLNMGFSDRIIAGKGPWILFDVGDQAKPLCNSLLQEGIKIQQQSGKANALSSNWVRISSTVPCEMEMILAEIARFFDRTHWQKAFRTLH